MAVNENDAFQLIGSPDNHLPLVICFHGSGDSCATWATLAETLSSTYRVLLFNRGADNPKPDVALSQLFAYLSQAGLSPPYLLIAHSYGGTFARVLLEQRPQEAAGMVLVETGQEASLDSAVEERQYRRQVLGARPLSVVRGNSMIGKQAQVDKALAAAGDDPTQRAQWRAQKELLDATDREDERLKKAQLRLSRNTRYVHVADCGHHVVRDRPDVVAEQVHWAMANLSVGSEHDGLRQRTSRLIRRLQHWLQVA
jgi:pimeloyl-ACP methyl ester carboxylesterase